MERTRSCAATSSIASGNPSSRRQISTTARWLAAVSSNPAAADARAANSSTAAYGSSGPAGAHRAGSGTANGGTSHTCSPTSPTARGWCTVPAARPPAATPGRRTMRRPPPGARSCPTPTAARGRGGIRPAPRTAAGQSGRTPQRRGDRRLEPRRPRPAPGPPARPRRETPAAQSPRRAAPTGSCRHHPPGQRDQPRRRQQPADLGDLGAAVHHRRELCRKATPVPDRRTCSSRHPASPRCDLALPRRATAVVLQAPTRSRRHRDTASEPTRSVAPCAGTAPVPTEAGTLRRR